MCALVDLKANAAETERAIEQIHLALQAKYEEFVREQRFINEALCPLNCLGKWIWHGGFTESVGFNPFAETQFRLSAFDRAAKAGPEVVKWA